MDSVDIFCIAWLVGLGVYCWFFARMARRSIARLRK